MPQQVVGHAFLQAQTALRGSHPENGLDAAVTWQVQPEDRPPDKPGNEVGKATTQRFRSTAGGEQKSSRPVTDPVDQPEQGAFPVLPAGRGLEIVQRQQVDPVETLEHIGGIFRSEFGEGQIDAGTPGPIGCMTGGLQQMRLARAGRPMQEHLALARGSSRCLQLHGRGRESAGLGFEGGEARAFAQPQIKRQLAPPRSVGAIHRTHAGG